MKKICTEDGTFTKDPHIVYDAIKVKLLRFVKTREEKQTMALQEWNCLTKGKASSLEFETRWERAIRKLKRYGLEKGPQELLLGYLGRISKQCATEIRKDRRTYTNPDGTQSEQRSVRSWEEAHALAVDIDNDLSATRAITQPVMDNQNPWREEHSGT